MVRGANASTSALGRPERRDLVVPLGRQRGQGAVPVDATAAKIAVLARRHHDALRQPERRERVVQRSGHGLYLRADRRALRAALEVGVLVEADLVERAERLRAAGARRRTGTRTT